MVNTIMNKLFPCRTRPDKDENMKVSDKLPHSIHQEFAEVFSGIRYSKGKLSFQEKDSMKPSQVTLSHVAYALQGPFKKELERLQKQQIIIPIGIIKPVEWCNSFVLVPSPNGTVWLCLDHVRLN